MIVIAYLFSTVLIVGGIVGGVILFGRIMDARTNATAVRNKELKAENAELKAENLALDSAHKDEVSSLHEVLNSIASGISADPQTEAKLALFNTYRRKSI